jgi:hypothetical protein
VSRQEGFNSTIPNPSSKTAADPRAKRFFIASSSELPRSGTSGSEWNE